MALTDTFVRFAKASKQGGDKHYDGGGLYIHVKPQGKYWRLDYRYLNKRKTMALGTYPEVALVKARKRRDDARVLLADGIDPAEARREEREAKLIAASHTFESVALKWLAMQAKMRSASTQDKVLAWLQHDVFPLIGKRPISAIKPRDVLAVAQKVEAREAYDSAHRIKQMCGQIFRYAVALDLVQRDVTADLRGALAVIPRSHHAALTEPKDVAALMRAIHGYDGYPVAKAALKLAPLLFVRPGELRAAEWAEIDLDGAEWRIPAIRMKMHIEHIVPLARQAVAILRKLYPVTGDGRYVFPSLRTANECMSENTVNAALRGLGYSKEQMTGHGFRAMARTMLDEVLGERVDLIEHQLAHAVKDPNGRAYNRTKHLQARREMMQRWADYLDRLRDGDDHRSWGD
ncbi:tyrosine-type recombinase/integrase [Duganella vulcania]|uniref:Integrase arm-type DNA-binding domain-containing protein n=1 Tax=Duganella vulcania TaxID=2692166 RepID=A0A845GQB4_9BURK|nr:integrase arm-type DNA-binding domain-containing protein [Duganella vulcania]MYM94907.1 integrase arm-type DNA-binding domain-containing protein [Duganella vulcania]